MRLLVVTQAVDRTNPVLGFFHRWLEELAKQYDALEVICLYEGEHDLPQNVRIHSLGKEHGERSKFAYGFTFIHLVFTLRSQYDSVFVHMNQEYLLVAGWLWKLLDKRTYLWRNHYAGSLLTDIAAHFSTKLFCTSRYSYIAKYKKTVFMPVGVDTAQFYPDPEVKCQPRSLLFLARMSPAKRPDVFIEALGMLKKEGVSFVASLYGSAPPKDYRYYTYLTERAGELGLTDSVKFHASIMNSETPNIFRAHELFVNCSPSGMFDKTIFEALASGCKVIAASDDWHDCAGEQWWYDGTPIHLYRCIKRALEIKRTPELQAIVASHSLSRLVDKLACEIVTTGRTE